MSRRSHGFNGFEAATAAPVNVSQTSIELTTVAGLEAPGKLTIDWDRVDVREWIRFTGIVGNTLTGVVRGDDGASSANGAVAHEAGALVRSTVQHQHLDDIFSDIEDLEDDIAAHAAAVNPHPGYATDADLAVTNAVVSTHTTQIAAVGAANTVQDTAIDALEAADLAHFGSIDGHPIVTTSGAGFMSATLFDKLARFGAGCKVSTSVLQTLGTGIFAFVPFDTDDENPQGIHTPASSLFTIPYTGFWTAKFRNTASTAMRRTVALRRGSTPGAGSLYVMANGTYLDSETGEAGRNTWVLGPEHFPSGALLHVELGDQTGSPSGAVGANSYFVLAFLGP